MATTQCLRCTFRVTSSHHGLAVAIYRRRLVDGAATENENEFRSPVRSGAKSQFDTEKKATMESRKNGELNWRNEFRSLAKFLNCPNHGSPGTFCFLGNLAV